MELHQLEIREARESDLEEIMRLLFQINSQHYQHVPAVFGKPEENDAAFWLKQLLDPEQLFLVAEYGGSLRGLITATVTTNPDVPFLAHHMICRVGTIVVDREQQRSGVGNVLMAQAERWARTKGAIEIRLEVMEFNHEAQKFYAKAGFETQSRNMSRSLV